MSRFMRMSTLTLKERQSSLRETGDISAPEMFDGCRLVLRQLVQLAKLPCLGRLQVLLLRSGLRRVWGWLHFRRSGLEGFKPGGLAKAELSQKGIGLVQR